MKWITEPLDKSFHNRDFFDCDVVELNIFLKQHANQNQLKNISKTYVAVHNTINNHKPKLILGYYTLSSGQIHCEQLPLNIKVKLPKHPVPIVRIGRLAVDKNYKGQGIGGFLLYDALSKVLDISEKIGIFAVIVDAKNADAKNFYKKYDFIELQESTMTLFLPIETIKLAKTINRTKVLSLEA